MKLFAPLLAAVLACSAATAYAQWIWVDKDGRKVFSDRAPSSDVPEKNILKRPSPKAAPAPVITPVEAVAAAKPAAAPASAASSPQSNVDKELEAKKKAAAEAEQAERRAAEARQTAARVENCARAKQAKAMLGNGLPTLQNNKAGTPEIMSDAQRAAEAKRLQGIIDVDCR